MLDVQPLSSRNLPSFDHAEPLAHGDEAFLQDIVGVMEKHGNLGRFGLCLIHDHFDVGVDEILLETNDPETRTLHLETVKLADLNADMKFTSWDVSKWDGSDLRGADHSYALSACDQDKCKSPMEMTACDQDKCKSPMEMTACDQDKCKSPMEMTACDQDKCKSPMEMTACDQDHCKSPMEMTACDQDKCKSPVV
ncbi:hypothetical protein [Labrenzia sp. OB1]|uniref:hypothetical protein n=1 Tax=Labrenzia sp. OB1 TaxID=1561204 RepID=UPI0009EDE1F4|nr:hypothetical protein [Labrenzia sp. OB1]